MKETPFLNVGAVVGSGKEHFTITLKVLGYGLVVMTCKLHSKKLWWW